MQPLVPMSPILTDRLPQGKEWGYQLKWDGYRILALVDQGKVELFSKKLLPQTGKYPELVQALARLQGSYLLDGEAVVLDPAIQRPSFQKMQQRGKLTEPSLIRRASSREPVQYIIFDLLQSGGEDLRDRPFGQRYELLQKLDLGKGSVCFLADLFEDGNALWSWAVANGWEGVVSKRLASRYSEGKDHDDWFKCKTVLHVDVEVVGILMKAGKVSSLAMRKNDAYIGRVSSGLNVKAKAALMRLPADATMEHYFDRLPEGLKGAAIAWLRTPLSCRVTGTQITEAGMLRHPKLLWLEGIPL